MVTCVDRFVPTAPPAEEGDGEGDNPDQEGDNEDQQEKEEEDVPPVEGADDEPGMWEETFKSHADSKPYGEWGIYTCVWIFNHM